MYPDLSYFLHDLLGTAPDNWFSIFKTYGFFLGAAIMVAAAFFRAELQRKENEGLLPQIPQQFAFKKTFDYTNYLFLLAIGFLIGYKGAYLLELGIPIGSAQFRPALISAKGNMPTGILMALFTLVLYQWLHPNRNQHKEQVARLYASELIHDIIVIAAISGIIGAKVFALLEELPALLANPIDTLLNSGISFYGGLIFGYISVYFYLKKRAQPMLPTLDAVAPALMISYGIGRLGCHFSGDGDWGITAAAQPDWWFLPDALWASTFPHNVIKKGIPIEGCTGQYCSELAAAVYPTSIYEFGMALAIFGLLWAMRKQFQTPGLLFSVYLIFNGIERFSIEFIRVNDKYPVAGMEWSQAQYIAIVLMALGLLMMLYLTYVARLQKSKPMIATSS